MIWRRNLKPTITVRADVTGGITGNDATAKINDDLQGLRASLPQGYSIEPAGYMEKSAQSAALLMQPVPMMVIVIITLLMVQLQSIFGCLGGLDCSARYDRCQHIPLLLTQRPLGVCGGIRDIGFSRHDHQEFSHSDRPDRTAFEGRAVALECYYQFGST